MILISNICIILTFCSWCVILYIHYKSKTDYNNHVCTTLHYFIDKMIVNNDDLIFKIGTKIGCEQYYQNVVYPYLLNLFTSLNDKIDDDLYQYIFYITNCARDVLIDGNKHNILRKYVTTHNKHEIKLRDKIICIIQSIPYTFIFYVNLILCD